MVFVVRDPTIRLLAGNGASRLGLNATELGRVGGDAHRAQLALRNGSTWLGLGCTADETQLSLTCSAPTAGQFAVVIAPPSEP